MLMTKQAWHSTTGSSGGLTAIELVEPPAYTVLYIDHSVTVATNSVSLQSAQFSTGPWFIETSTVTSSAVSTNFALRVTGPIGPWVRPYLHATSTGTFDFLLVGV